MEILLRSVLEQGEKFQIFVNLGSAPCQILLNFEFGQNLFEASGIKDWEVLWDVCISAFLLFGYIMVCYTTAST